MIVGIGVFVIGTAESALGQGDNDKDTICIETKCPAPRREHGWKCEGASELLAEETEEALNRLTGIVEKLDTVSAAAEDFQFEEKSDEHYMCKIAEDVEDELMCEIGELDEEFTQSHVRAVVQCVKNGDVRKTKTTFEVDGRSFLKIGKVLQLLDIQVKLLKDNEETHVLYHCRNSETNEEYVGTLWEIKQWYRKFLESQKRRRD